MKTLILSCNTGGGHNSTANGIREYFESKNESVEIVDALSLISQKTSIYVTKIHAFIYKYIPYINQLAYNYAEKNEHKFTDNFIGYKILQRGVDNLKRKIESGQFDTVICTHIFSAYMLSFTIKKHGICPKTAFITTDYSFTPGLQRSSFDAYFIPHKKLVENYAKKGINKNKIIPSGIPVRKEFLVFENKNKAKTKINLPIDGKHVVISAGSIGCGPIKKIALTLSKNNKNINVSAVCGNNKKLKKALEKVAKKQKNLVVYGFTDKMPLLLASADVYITKGGGLSLTEALIKKVPTVIINSVKGCEEANVKFFVKEGLATSSVTAISACKKCYELLSNKSSYDKILRALKLQENSFASKKIYETLKFNTNFISV